MVGFLVVLIIIVTLCLIKIEFSWGFINRKELLETATGILGSYLGIVATYSVFILQIKKKEDIGFMIHILDYIQIY